MNDILHNVCDDYPDYLRDESRLKGEAFSISFPKSEEVVRRIVSSMEQQLIPVTLQGARTGITGGAVPRGGHVMNLSRMNRITGLVRYDDDDSYGLVLQPGVILSNLREAVKSGEFDAGDWSDESLAALEGFCESGRWFFPPDPTETSATLGGMVSTNASGACSLLYGATRNFVRGLRVMTVDGSILDLRRGREKANGRSFALVADNGERFTGILPSYRMPSVKNAAGYFNADNMDMVDLFIGSEGTLGIVTEIEIRLIRAPVVACGAIAFFEDDVSALDCVLAVRESDLKPAAIEFFDSNSLDLLRREKTDNPAFAELPDLPARYHSGVYVEYHVGNEDALYDALGRLLEATESHGGSDDETWVADNEHELGQMKNFRHAVPEAVNLLIDRRRASDPSITKLGTDMSVPDDKIAETLAMYKSDMRQSGLEYVMFGHVGDNHLHVNLLPRSIEDYETGKRLYRQWARKIVEMQGSVSAEHGIGKLKTDFLLEMYGETGVEEMRRLKKAFDPQCLLNRGNLFVQS